MAAAAKSEFVAAAAAAAVWRGRSFGVDKKISRAIGFKSSQRYLIEKRILSSSKQRLNIFLRKEMGY